MLRYPMGGVRNLNCAMERLMAGSTESNYNKKHDNYIKVYYKSKIMNIINKLYQQGMRIIWLDMTRTYLQFMFYLIIGLLLGFNFINLGCQYHDIQIH